MYDMWLSNKDFGSGGFVDVYLDAVFQFSSYDNLHRRISFALSGISC